MINLKTKQNAEVQTYVGRGSIKRIAGLQFYLIFFFFFQFREAYIFFNLVIKQDLSRTIFLFFFFYKVPHSFVVLMLLFFSPSTLYCFFFFNFIKLNIYIYI